MDNNKYTDEQLKRALAKMLPDILELKFVRNTVIGTNANKGCWVIWWKGEATAIFNTELLYLCDLLEQSLDEQQELKYDIKLYDLCYDKGIPQYRAPWQDRVIAAAEARNIVID